MPDTTPMANETAKILVQKRARRCRCSRPVAIQRTSSVAMNADSPMVKLGKMMWNMTVKANCSRASRTGSRAGLESIGHSPGSPRRALMAQIGCARQMTPSIPNCSHSQCHVLRGRGQGAARSRIRVGSWHHHRYSVTQARGISREVERCRAVAGGLAMTDATRTAAEPSALDRHFGLTASGTSVRTELVAGITTFLTMVYIVFVNPQILSNAGMDKGAVFVATCVASAVCTLAMG